MTRRRDKQWNFPWRSEKGKAGSGVVAGAQGYAFLIMMMMVTILLISLTAALPSIYAEGQRENEEELIFRGREYARAIILFHNKFGRYPSKIDELVKKTNGIRFLRHAYRDPMTASGTWRYIHANAAGMVIDSKTITMQAGPTTKGGSRESERLGGAGNRGFSLSGPGIGQPQESTVTSNSNQSESKANDTSQPNGQLLGGFIVGVASTSTKKSFRVLNNETEYDKWEFLAVGQDARNLIAPGGNPGGQNQPNGLTGPGARPGPGPTGGPGKGPGTVTGPI